MASVFTVVLIIVLSLLVTRIAATGLMLTGLSSESARFQARSALTGTGFTTSEAESVVNHPVRRRIIMFLMLVGRAGIVSVMASLTVSMTGAEDSEALMVRLAVLTVAVLMLVVVARSQAVDRLLSRVIERALRRYTSLDVRDYAGLLHLSEDYAVVEMIVVPGGWVAGRSLGELRLRDEGILVLGIERADGSYEGAPKKHSVPREGDTMLLYGRDCVIRDLQRRRADAEGELLHRRSVEDARDQGDVPAAGSGSGP